MKWNSTAAIQSKNSVGVEFQLQFDITEFVRTLGGSIIDNPFILIEERWKDHRYPLPIVRE